MTTTTTFPLDKICQALDILQDHGVLSDNLVEHELGCWLEENDLTCDDLNNFQPEQASRSEIDAVFGCYRQLFQFNPKEALKELTFVKTQGGRRDLALEFIQEFENNFAEDEEAQEN